MKPILFNTEMVRAILEGRKTCTRRVVKKDKVDAVLSSPARMGNPDIHDDRFIKCLCTAPCEIGDILYVRETWCSAYDGERYFYLSDKHTDREEKQLLDYNDVKWRPSIHMPKEAARLFLRVTDVRVERIQTSFCCSKFAIFELKKEGVELQTECIECILNYGVPGCIATDDNTECGMLDETRANFSNLWDSTIKKSEVETYGWAANPWVWVIEFERCEKPEDVDHEKV